jgi:acetyl/propionyl-CoA carboxylase alpha subunit
VSRLGISHHGSPTKIAQNRHPRLRFGPPELRTDVTGKIVRFLQEDGAHVEAGQPYVEVEAMKMIMPLKVGAAFFNVPFFDSAPVHSVLTTHSQRSPK